MRLVRRQARTTVYGIDVATEAGLDAILGPCVAVFGAAVRLPIDDADPLSWPACPRCGARRPELLVDSGEECAECFHGWVGRVIAAFRPYRRALPEETGGGAVNRDNRDNAPRSGWSVPAGVAVAPPRRGALRLPERDGFSRGPR